MGRAVCSLRSVGIWAIWLLYPAIAQNHGAGHTTLSLVASFAPDAGGSFAGLVMDSSGNMFGTTQSSANSDGTVFELAADDPGTIITLATFNGADGATPSAGLSVIDGDIYGTTYDGGADSVGLIFEI